MKNPTPKQKKAAKAVLQNLLKDQPRPLGEVLEKVGYGTIVQDPQRITQSEGFKNALAEIGLRQALVDEGINPKKIAEKINVLLEANDKEGNKDYTAIDKGLKHATAIYGITEEPPKNPSGNTYNFIFSKEVQSEVQAIETRIKQMLVKPNVQTN